MDSIVTEAFGPHPTSDGAFLCDHHGCTFVVLRILLVVNAFASSVTARNTVWWNAHWPWATPAGAIRSKWSRRIAAGMPRASHRMPRAVASTSSSASVVTARSTKWPPAWRAPDTALGVLPGGSTNVFARTLGMPNDPVLAVQQLAAGIAAGSIEPIGLGKVNGRYFCFHTGVGYDAAVVQEVERRASLKRWLGHRCSSMRRMRTWAVNYDRQHPHFTVATPAAPPVSDGYFTVVLNTNPYTYLGNRPLDLSPAATLDRGLVAITFRSMRVAAILGALSGALRGGGVKASATLDVQTDLTELTVSHDTPFPYQLDGDYLGETSGWSSATCPRPSGWCAPNHPAPDHREGHVGHVGADAVDTPRDELTHPIRVVAGPCVHL